MLLQSRVETLSARPAAAGTIRAIKALAPKALAPKALAPKALVAMDALSETASAVYQALRPTPVARQICPLATDVLSSASSPRRHD